MQRLTAPPRRARKSRGVAIAPSTDARDLEEAQELARLGSVIVHADGRMRASKMVGAVLGISDLAACKSLIDFAPSLSEPDRTRFCELTARAKSLESASEILETDVISALGRAIHVRIKRRDDDDGRALYCTFQDITERRRMEEALRASEQRRSRLWEQLTNTQDEERRRISQALYDRAGCSLAAVVIRCRALEGRVHDPRLREAVRELGGQIDGCLADLSNLARALHPAAIDELGLGPALRELAHATLSSAGIDATILLDLHEAKLDPRIKLSLYRAAQEAFANVVKHAGATRVELRCEMGDASVTMEVVDDGRGIQSDDTPLALDAVGLGLLAVRERAQLFGGELFIVSERAFGTRLVLRLPTILKTP